MTNLLIHWAPSGENSITVRTDFCCRMAAEAYSISHPKKEVEGKLNYESLRLRLFRRHKAEAFVGMEATAIIDIPFYALGLPNGSVIAFCPFCGAKVISINDATGERTDWSQVLKPNEPSKEATQ